EAHARERVAELEPLVPRLVVDVRAGGATPELEVRRDGALVGKEQLSKPVVVDPGEHVVTATAPGKKSWYTTVKVNANGATLSVQVPELEDAVTAARAPTAVLRRETVFDETVGKPQGNTQRLAAVGLGAVSVISLGLGIVFGLQAKLRLDESNTFCH